MNIMLIVFFILFALQRGWIYMLDMMNLSYMKKKAGVLPPEMEGMIDRETLKRSSDYEADKTGFGIIEGICLDIATIILIFAGLLDFYNSLMSGLYLPFIPAGIFYFLFLAYAASIFNIPFQLYDTFRIEKKFSFNTMTPGLWASDFIKSFVIETILISALAAAGLWIVQASPKLWWLFIWLFYFLFSIFMMYISPYVLEPLFNKYTPLDNEELEAKIKAVLGRAGIRVSRVFKVDSSKRSRHSNAYFTGIGRVKRIVIFDTLLRQLSTDEIVAVIAHEAGHWKKRHVLKSILINEIFTFTGLYLAFLLINTGWLTSVFNIRSGNFFVKAVLAGFIAGLAMFFLSPLSAYYSRRNEREADRYAVESVGGYEAMSLSLIKIARENLSNLYPHPLYAGFHYSHPPLTERLEYIKNCCGELKQI